MTRVEIETTSSPAELGRIRAFVRRVCDEPAMASLGETGSIQLELAVHEAATNIMEHAYRGRLDGRIVVEAEGAPERLAIRLYHWGEPFDPAAAQRPASAGSRECGFGLFIIENCVDEVRYSCDAQGRNCICLVKRLRKG